jgi:starch phosphorylase
MTPITGDESEASSRTRFGHEKIRTGLGADAIAEALIDNLYYLQAKLPLNATRNDWYMALAYTVRDRMLVLVVAM